MPDAGFYEYVVGDVLSGMDGISSRAMFGGWGIYKDGKIFAIIAGGKLYFKVGKSNRADFEKHDSEPFCYTGRGGKPHAMSYWELPQEILDDKEKVSGWIEAALAVHIK